MVVQRIAGVLLALWAGSLVTVCGLVAPSLFAVLERSVAGRLAARFFLAETIIGCVVAVIVLVAQRLTGFALPRPALIAILVAALAPLASELILGPMMEAARAAGDMGRFGALHGVSAVLFATACGAAVFAVWAFNRPAA